MLKHLRDGQLMRPFFISVHLGTRPPSQGQNPFTKRWPFLGSGAFFPVIFGAYFDINFQTKSGLRTLILFGLHLNLRAILSTDAKDSPSCGAILSTDSSNLIVNIPNIFQHIFHLHLDIYSIFSPDFPPYLLLFRAIIWGNIY